MFLEHKSLILNSLAALLYAGSTGAFAEDPQLQAEPAQMDSRQIQTAPLQGRVNQTDTDQTNGDGAQPLNGSTTGSQNGATPLSGDAQNNANPDLRMQVPQAGSGLFHLAGRKYTAQEFRNMNYGIIGMVCLRPLFGGKQTVIAVYPGCPAALAGIRPGDVEIQTDNRVLGNFENQRSTWNVTDGEAGTPVDLTVRRGRDLITFHMIRMNIEDIQDERVRRGFERLLEKLGPPNKQHASADSN